jgi:hypothetical protein
VFHVIDLLGEVEEYRSKPEPDDLESNPNTETDVRLFGQNSVGTKERAYANDGAQDPEDLPSAASSEIDRYSKEDPALTSDNLRCWKRPRYDINVACLLTSGRSPTDIKQLQEDR